MLRKSMNKRTSLNHILPQFSFSIKSQAEVMENEIMKSFTSMNKKFNINKEKSTPNKTSNNIYFSTPSNNISMDYMKSKYYDNPSKEDIDNIIKVLFREEVMNIKQEKTFEDLILFIKNCKKYNYPEYLTDVKFFQNKDIRHFMTNTNLLESLHQKDSPFNIEKEFEMKVKVQNLYKLRKGQKGEKLDPMTEKEFESQKYQYLNYLAETPSFEKLNKMKRVKAKNSAILKDFLKGDKMVEKEEEMGIRDEVWKNHYIEYYKKMKRQERRESLGASVFEENEFNEQIEQEADRIFQTKTNPNREKEEKMKKQEEEAFEKSIHQTAGNRVYQNEAYTLNDGHIEPFPYFGMKDYPIEEFFDETKTAPGKEIVYVPLQKEHDVDLLPPKLADYWEDFAKDTWQWSSFTVHYQNRIMFRNVIKSMTAAMDSLSKEDYKNKDNFSLFDISYPQSLIYYYNLLPKWAREHPSVKMIVRGLEFHQPWASYQEKINMVNLALQIVMKKDKYYMEQSDIALDAHPEDITSENLPSLLEHDEERERNILQDPEDEATDDDDLEIVSTAEEVRAIEREEEEERKRKKKEEGRAKRAAEEAKQAAAEGKLDKAEEKRKKEEAEKKKKKEADAAAEGEDAEEHAEEHGEDEKEAEKVTSKDIEERIFDQSTKIRGAAGRDEEVLDIYDAVRDKMMGITRQNIGEDESENDGEEDSGRRHLGSTDENEGDQETNEYESLEAFKRSYKEERVIISSKREKLKDIVKDLNSSDNMNIIEEKLLLIRKNLEDSSTHFRNMENEEQQSQLKGEEIDRDYLRSKYNLSKDNLLVYPLSLLESNQLSEKHKAAIRKVFSKYLDLYTKDANENMIKLDEEKGELKAEDVENEIMQRVSRYEAVSQTNNEGYELDLDYRESLKDADLKIDTTEEHGLTDVFYKHFHDPDYVERTEDPIPFDYYLNEDGFWNDYINFHKGRVDVRQFTHQPFNTIRRHIKRKTDVL